MSALVFATGPVHLDEDGDDLRADLGEALSHALDAHIEVRAETSYAALRERVLAREIALAWLPPALYVKTQRAGAIGAVLRAERLAGASYQGAIFVREDSALRSASDLAGKRVAWVDPDSCAGYLFPRLALRAAGIDPDGCFASETFLESHSLVVGAVASGTCDAGATHVQLADASEPSKGLAIAGWTAFAEASSMRAIVVSPSIPSDAVCIGAAVPGEVREKWRVALGSVHGQPSMSLLLRAMLGVDRLTPGAPDDYAPVRDALAAEGD
nr:PhnD/SsuA/transferrin family substrate-binding protein [Myxococcota bacterium]